MRMTTAVLSKSVGIRVKPSGVCLGLFLFHQSVESKKDLYAELCCTLFGHCNGVMVSAPVPLTNLYIHLVRLPTIKHSDKTCFGKGI